MLLFFSNIFFKMLDEIGLEKEEKVKSKNAIQRHDKSFKDILKNKLYENTQNIYEN